MAVDESHFLRLNDREQLEQNCALWYLKLKEGSLCSMQIKAENQEIIVKMGLH